MDKKLSKKQLKILKNNVSPDGWEYDDDCAVCQYMKRMDFAGQDQTFEGLNEAFQEAKEKGAIVGNELDLDLLEKDLA